MTVYFSKFIKNTFNISDEQLAPAIKYVSGFASELSKVWKKKTGYNPGNMSPKEVTYTVSNTFCFRIKL